MRKITLSLFIIILSLTQASACDICGCSAGNYFVGPFPQFKKHFLGLRYSLRSYHSIVADDNTEFSKDTYQSLELWGGMNIGKHWQVLGFMPYNINQQKSDDGSRKSNAIGDLSLLANYKLFNKKSALGNSILSQQLMLGFGVKLPTGKFAPDADDLIPAANNQAGSGSLDYLLNTMYTIQWNDWGLNNNINYKINQAAKNFQFGNRLTMSSVLFKSFYRNKSTLMPNVGLACEHLQANKTAGTKIEASGGHALLGTAGLEVGFKKINVGLNIQQPLKQNLSDHQTTAKTRGMLHVNFAF